MGRTHGDTLGAMLHPQCRGVMARRKSWQIVETCALGAVYDALGELRDKVSLGEPEWLRVLAALPLLRRVAVQCPACALTPYGDDGFICANITHLNDDHLWSREQIADWVESIEQQQPAPVPAPSAATEA